MPDDQRERPSSQPVPRTTRPPARPPARRPARDPARDPSDIRVDIRVGIHLNSTGNPQMRLRRNLAGTTALTTTLAVVATLATVTTAGPAQAAPTDVVINEMMYHALSDLDGDDYLELTNKGTTPVDLSG